MLVLFSYFLFFKQKTADEMGISDWSSDVCSSDLTFTAAYFDHIGLYAFGRQAEAIHWDVVQLARSLAAIAEAETLTPVLETFPADFQAALVETVLGRLGVKPKCDGRDTDLLVALETALAKKTV